MRFRRFSKYHGLKRGRVRMTWNKYNLYNLANLKLKDAIWPTFFQQKWAAKAVTRAYHGDHVKEHKWERMFNRRLNSVVNMDPKYMAASDGSEQGAGRGSGKDRPCHEDLENCLSPAEKQRLTQESQISRTDMNIRQKGPFTRATPYMNMTYAPLERRLDIAIFRSMFASSARQARQFVIHGGVKVNGMEMRHPSYLLNPGDMFQVKPDFVMLATGRKKFKGGLSQQPTARNSKSPKSDGPEAEEAEAEEEAAESAEKPSDSAKAAEEETEADPAETVARLRHLSKWAKDIMAASKNKISGKQKQRIRAFLAEAKATISRAGGHAAPNPQALTGSKTVMDDITERLNQLTVNKPKKPKELVALEAGAAAEKAAAAGAQEPPEEEPRPAQPASRSDLTTDELQIFNQLLREEEENPADASKPYRTPWQPRPFMSAFAFIPRYLEVNPNICAAVYLRHPVARQNLAEVPSPFPPSTMQLAFNWYLRRR